MEERRILLNNLIDEDDIPSSAVAWDGTGTAPTGKVVYIPIMSSNYSVDSSGEQVKASDALAGFSYFPYVLYQVTEATVTTESWRYIPHGTWTLGMSSENRIYMGIEGQRSWDWANVDFNNGYFFRGISANTAKYLFFKKGANAQLMNYLVVSNKYYSELLPLLE